MLSSRFRFHSRGGVRYVYRHGKTIRASKLSLIHAENSRGFQRFAVVVSKKVEKTAVSRNRIRRRFYEAIRLYKKQHNFNVSKDFIFVIYSREFLDCDFAELEGAISSLIEQSMI